MAAAPPSGSEQLLRCWRCKTPQPPAFFCPQCDAVQLLPSNLNYSTLLGFGGLPTIDEKELEERYYEFSRRLHPDRFQTGSTEEQRASLHATALLNTAYKTLKDIEARGRWWLESMGESLGRNNNQVPTELAADVFEIQEKVAEARAASGATADELRTELRRIEEDLSDRLNEKRDAVSNLLQRWPPDNGSVQAPRRDLKHALSDLSYLGTLARDVRQALED